MPEPLWGARDQAARLAELTASTEDRVKEHPLRRDVRSLGILLGRVLVEQAGEPVFENVERLRRLLIQARVNSFGPGENDPHNEEMKQARAIIQSLGVEEAYWITKAFAIYFELTNLAETNHRKRRRRAGKVHPDQAPLPGSFRGTLLRMKNAGMSAEQALAELRKVTVLPVFTAHPTEVARRTVLQKRRRISRSLEALDRLPLSEADAVSLENAVVAEISALWQTDEVRVQKPLVTDEIRMGLTTIPCPFLRACRASTWKFAIRFAMCTVWNSRWRRSRNPFSSDPGLAETATAIPLSLRRARARHWSGLETLLSRTTSRNSSG